MTREEKFGNDLLTTLSKKRTEAKKEFDQTTEQDTNYGFWFHIIRDIDNMMIEVDRTMIITSNIED